MSLFEEGMFWHDTRCTDGTVDCLERYLVYQVGKWLDCNGARDMVWVGKVSHLWKVILESVKDMF
jgi:hypothetical protein